MSTEVGEKKEWVPGYGRLLPVAAIAALVIGVVGALALNTQEPDVAASTIELNAGGQDPMAMCIQFSVEELAKAPIAFEGTVTNVDGSQVTMKVDNWFKGGDAEQAVLNAPQGLEALIDGFPFETGQTYLITAYDGTVNYCGFSGEATPELRAAFEQAFGA